MRRRMSHFDAGQTSLRLAAFEPDIPQNLGAMIRLSACFGFELDVIEPCGFPFSVKSLRRSAMDYADQAKIRHHTSWDAFLDTVENRRIVLLTTKSTHGLWQFNFSERDILLVGRESAGVTPEVTQRADAAISLPMPGGGRSLNVANCASIAMAEAFRQTGYWNL